jgi:signal transduction histidine kinase
MQFCPTSRGRLYGDLAFAVLVPTAFAQFLFDMRPSGEPWQVITKFGLGAVYSVLGILGNDLSIERPRPRLRVHAYYITQCLIASAAILIRPERGGLFILCMPLIAQSIFDYTWRGAALITVWLYAASIGIYWSRGLPVTLEVSIAYLPAFLFTLLFSVITREASFGKRRAEKMSAELAAANEQLRANAAQAQELATTHERNRLAREIHDGLGHYLTVIKVQLDAASALLATEPQRAAESVAKAARLAGEALDDVRRSVGTLRNDDRPPLADLLGQLASDATPAPALRIEGTPRLLGAAAEHALYRTAQEGLTNLRKHAAATAATLTLDFRDASRVRLTLADNGRGASAPASGGKSAGYGLRGLRERIEVLGGTLTAANGPEGGFTLSAEVPA